MDKSMYLPNHPCYGVDICHAYSLDEMERLRGQGYLTWKEFVELANRADELQAQVAQLRDALEMWDDWLRNVSCLIGKHNERRLSHLNNKVRAALEETKGCE